MVLILPELICEICNFLPLNTSKILIPHIGRQYYTLTKNQCMNISLENLRFILENSITLRYLYLDDNEFYDSHILKIVLDTYHKSLESIKLSKFKIINFNLSFYNLQLKELHIDFIFTYISLENLQIFFKNLHNLERLILHNACFILQYNPIYEITMLILQNNSSLKYIHLCNTQIYAHMLNTEMRNKLH